MYQTRINSQEEIISNVQLNEDIQFGTDATGGYHAIINGERVLADLVKIDEANNQVVLRIKGKKIFVNVKRPVDLMVEKIGIKQTTVRKANNLKAPMPGLILKLLVKEGQSVKQGDSLLVLEAMKMENVFKAAHDSIIKEIKISEKQAVEKGEELITFVS